MLLLDPTLDIVFKLLLSHEPALLVHMLQGVLGRRVEAPAILDPDIPREHVGKKRVILDLRVALEDGSRADLEMQRRTLPSLVPRLVYYAARDYGGQLAPGDHYDRLTPTSVIAWLGEPLEPRVDLFHSVFELRERHTNVQLTDHLAFHFLQLSKQSPLASRPTNGYDAVVDRWARFFNARSDAATLAQLAAEDPMMRLATQTLEALSQDPATCRLASLRESENAFYEMDLAASREAGLEQGLEQGLARGRVDVLLALLHQRFGSLPAAVHSRVQSASATQLDAWLARILTARSLDELFGR